MEARLAAPWRLRAGGGTAAVGLIAAAVAATMTGSRLPQDRP
jgi:hypothetical protein